MDSQLAISKVAAILADPTRLEMLLVLMDGRSFPIGELAARAHISNSTASHHLAVLTEAGFVQVMRQGRHRYLRLSNPRIAEVIESLGLLVGPSEPPNLGSAQKQALTPGRSCYNHLAGRLGVHLASSLQSQAMVIATGESFQLTREGVAHLETLGLQLEALSGKVCLDWTERVPHIGGNLGRALFRSLLERGWISRGEMPRQICLTELGRERFYEAFPPGAGLPGVLIAVEAL